MRNTLPLLLLLTVVVAAGCGKGGSEISGNNPPDNTNTADAGSTQAADAGPSETPDAGPDTTTPDAGQPQQQTYLHEWVVSPTGSDIAGGTSAAPYRTIAKAISAAGPGDRITVKAGTYAEGFTIDSSVAAGTADQPIRLQGEGMPRLVPTGSSWRMIAVSRPYWQIDGFEFDAQSQAKVPVVFTGTLTGTVLSNSDLHHGTAGAGIVTAANANGVTIQDNHIHNFWSSVDSHGVNVQSTSKNITIRRNVLHDNSGDSVQCTGPEDENNLDGSYCSPTLFAAGGCNTPADGVVIEGNDMSADQEQAVDVKTCKNVRIANNVMHDYTLTGGCSMVIHISAVNVTVEDNKIFNVGNAIAIGGNHWGPVPYNVVVRHNRIWNVRKSTTWAGVAIRLENSDQAKILNNTIWKTDAIAIKAGGGDQGNTTNLTVKNNILAPNTGGYALYLGSYLSGLTSRTNLFAPGAQVSAVNGAGGREALSFAAWQASGQDTGSRQADPLLDATTLIPGPVAVDWGENVGLAYCGAGPDVGGVETGCP